MIKKPAAKIAAVAILVGGLAITALLDQSEPNVAPEALLQSPPSPHFTIRWQRGEMTLAGHTLSEDHERALRQTVGAYYPGVPLQTDFSPMAVVPAFWADTTLQILTLLAETDAAIAEVSTATVSIRSVTNEKPGWQERLDLLNEALPADVSLFTDTLIVDNTISVSRLCERAFASFETAPISFEESTAVFRSSALPELERVVALATTCLDSSVQVTGHSDASGSESWNQRLSLERATAVGDYLTAKGLEPNRLLISGMGESVPIADNATRYGRSKNRRIEIVLRITPAPLDSQVQ